MSDGFESLLDADQQAEIRTILGDLVQGTFGGTTVTVTTKIRTPGVYGESPQEQEVTINLTAMPQGPNASAEERTRINVDYDESLLFAVQHLDNAGLNLRDPAFSRHTVWEVNGIKYRQAGVDWDAHIAGQPALVWVLLKQGGGGV